MQSKVFIILTILICPLLSRASHIAGAEFTFVYSGTNANGNNTYQLTFHLYQDCKNGDAAAIKEDNPANFSIFRKSDNAYISTMTVSASGPPSRIPFGVDPYCYEKLPDLCLQDQKFIFSIVLPKPGEANYDPEGYTISYQRCCRNNVLSNIINPSVSGSSFYTTIPSTITNNSPVYLSPPPLIICNGFLQHINYGAYDSEGDSLSYRLCGSHAGASQSNPKPNVSSPPPYPLVTYQIPYSATSPVSSSTPITIDYKTGNLTFTPDRFGIYTVAICIDEYRNGQKIGEHHRETQFYITNCSKKSYADIPSIASNPDIHQIVCNDFTVHFNNKSHNSINYLWDFGDPNNANDTSYLKFPSHTYSDTGTYLVKLYTDYDKQCPDSTTKYVKVYPYFLPGFIKDGGSCPGIPVTLIDTTYSSFLPVNNRTWYFGDGTIKSNDSIVTHLYPNKTEDYNVLLIVSNEQGCLDTANKLVKILGVDVFAGNDTTVVKNLSFKLNSRAEDTVSWTPTTYMDDPHSANPTFNFPKSGTYTYVLFSMNEAGCWARDTVVITVTDKAYFFIPTAFTPNGDNLNDYINIKSAGISRLLSFNIFNRWGQLLMNTADIKSTWDGTFNGKNLDVGTYFWVAEAVNLQGERIIEKGEINLLR